MSARDDYPWKQTIAAQRAQHGRMCDEIDRHRRHAEMLAAALLTRGVTAAQCDALDQWLRELWPA